MKTINYSRDKLNAKILEHFKEIGVKKYSESKYDNSEDIKEKFELTFTDYDLNESCKCDFNIIYCLDYVPVIDFEQTKIYTSDNVEEVKLNLKTVNYKPTKEILYEVLSDIADKQDKTDEENARSAKDIEETNEWLNENQR